jgi:hypothetical protein
VATEANLVAKVAAKLGKDVAAVQAAYDDAVAAVRKAALDAKAEEALEALVESGRLTQAQADELKSWLAARPSSVDRLPGAFGMHGWKSWPGGEFRLFKASPAGSSDEVHSRMAEALGVTPEAVAQALKDAHAELALENRLAALDEALADLVADGRLTQAEADEIKAWAAQAPAALSGAFGGLFPGAGPVFPALPFGGPPGELGSGLEGPRGHFEFRGPRFDPHGSGERFEFRFNHGGRGLFKGPGFQLECEFEGDEMPRFFLRPGDSDLRRSIEEAMKGLRGACESNSDDPDATPVPEGTNSAASLRSA